MGNAIHNAFLHKQWEEGLDLARNSDLVQVFPGPESPPQRYVVEFGCRGLVRDGNGVVVEADRFAIGIYFPPEYLRHVAPVQILTWLAPLHVFHPNIRPPYVCVGRLVPGTSLVDIVYQLFEIISYNKLTMREDDALNWDACAWARQNQHRFPTDNRPLRRRAVSFQVNVRETNTQA
jgi:hypothetical protein